MTSPRTTRRSFVVTAMSAVAGLWAAASGASVVSLLAGCKGEERVAPEPDAQPSSSSAVADGSPSDEGGAGDTGAANDATASAAPASASAAVAPASASAAASASAPSGVRKYGGVPPPPSPIAKYGGPPRPKYGGIPRKYGGPSTCNCPPGDLACHMRCR